MTRSLLVLATLAALTACHPPSLRDRARAMGDKLGAMGGKVAAIVKPVTPSTDVLQKLATDEATAKILAAAAQGHGQAQADGSLSFTKSVDLGGGGGGGDTGRAPDPAPSHHAGGGGGGGGSSIPVTIHRTQAPATISAMRMTTLGGATSCKVYPAMDQCTSTCTSMLKEASWAGLDAKRRSDPNLLRSCSCSEEDPGRCK